ncbi:glycosyltransferase [Cognatishimia maritima]|uniref:Glycosyltransferase involved in cell wall bisynthesis n=1 Tax=Cognatishimia maritima TaxID=870908 RepID=A0A1M5WEC5_9RHOB|nr:glycosyltransferase [Cognatishimia maritima]SHH85810.1 Glycosyltransferase involved in cell wall bisynthesis [Cognatishimia maritima]
MSVPHILVINIYFAPYTYGGATVVAEQVAHHLKDDHGYRVTAISAMSRSDMPPYAILKSEVDGIVNYLINLPFGRSYGQTYDNSEVTEVVARLIRRLEPDLVHLHCLQDIGAGVIGAAKRQGVPVILSTHDFWWLCERQFMIRTEGRYCGQDPIQIENCKGCVDDLSRAQQRMERLKALAAEADLLTFPSQFAHDLCTRSGLVAQDSMVWANGVHLPGQDFPVRQAARRAAESRLVFGFVGGPSLIKGWPIIRKAFSQLKADQEFDALLVEGSLDGSWWGRADFSDLPGRWQVVPRFAQAEMDGFYARIDVLLFMSQWKETFGLTIREALARGIRVIQTDSGGTVEHPAADPERLLPIGAGPECLVVELKRVLAEKDMHPDALDVVSFADQALTLHRRVQALL